MAADGRADVVDDCLSLCAGNLFINQLGNHFRVANYAGIHYLDGRAFAQFGDFFG